MVAPGHYGVYRAFSPQTVNAERFDLSFEAKASNDIHISFMCSKVERSHQAWEIVFGGWGNTRSVIRHGNHGGELVAVGGSPCNRNVFKTYSISLSQNILSVYNDNKLFMRARVPSLGCSNLFIGKGAWNTPIEYRNFEIDENDSKKFITPVALSGLLPQCILFDFIPSRQN